MGVHGLWRLLDPVGKPIPVETLENQVIAVDVSIWLHQLMKGFQDSAGSTVPNAHLVGLFHRICKLLFFRIKPVFVFDGGVPTLKKKTIANRNQLKDRAAIASEKARQHLLKNLLKQKAIGQVLEDLKAKPGALSSSQRQPDLYELPPIAEEIDYSEDSDDRESSISSEDDYKKKKKYKDLHTIDVKSTEFKALPADIRHDILTDLKETRKQNSWGRIHELPEDMGGFSSYQMNRLLKRRSVQVSLEEAEKEMGGHTLSLGDIEMLLADQGVDTASSVAGRRIASDNVTRYVYANDRSKAGSQLDKETKNTERLDDGKANDSVKWEDEDEIVIIDDEIICTSAIKVKTEKNDDPPTEGVEVQKLALQQIKVEEESDSSESAIFEDIIKEEMELRKQFATDDMGISQEQILLLIKEQKNAPKSKDKELGSHNVPSTSKELVDSRVVTRKNNQELVEINTSDEVEKSDKNLGKGKSDVKMVESVDAINMVENEDAVLEIEDESPPEVSNCDEDKNITSKKLRTSNISIIKELSNLDEPPVDGEVVVSKNKSEKIDYLSDLCQETKKESRIIDNDSLEITVNTKKNAVNEEEDIFADIFLSNLNNSGENIANLLEKEGKKADKDVELMSTETSSSEDDMEAVSGNDSSSVDGAEVKSVRGNDHTNEEDGSKNDEDSSDQQSSQYFKSSDSDLVKSTEKSSDNTANDKKHAGENVSNDEADNGLQADNSGKRILSTKELRGLQSILEKQEVELLQVHGREERLASTVTEQMRLEAEELLQLFGVPWIKAPMEAEAQCAFLDLVGLTQGTITDDSDIWLFGAHRVYKNFFNQKKYVLQFRSDDIKSFFKLSRGDLIELALLVGSDYTVGINGIGPVTALEIISTFRPSSSTGESILNTLQAFKNWLQHPSNSKTSQLARKLKDVELDDGFPSKDVVDAYLKPCVDESEEAFSWGSPDVDGLKTYAQRKFGWSQSKVDELLQPVLKSLTQKTSQTRIETFFNMKPSIPQHSDKVSRRVQRAVERMSGEVDEGEDPSSRGRALLAEESSSSAAAGGSRSRGKRRARGGRGGGGGIRDEIRIATEKDRFRSRQPRTRAQPAPLVAAAGPSTAAATAALHRIPKNKAPCEELIPQRERDRLEGLKRKIQAIQVLKKKKVKKISRAPIKREANLSESSGSSSD